MSNDEGVVEERLEAQAHVYNHLCSFINSMSLNCAIELGIPDIIHNHGSPINLSDLAAAIPIPSSKTHHLYRLMRILVHTGIFSLHKTGVNQGEEEGYLLTPLSNLLVKSQSNDLSPFLLLVLDRSLVSPWHCFSDWFKSEVPAAPFEFTNNAASMWEVANRSSQFNSKFNEGMASDSGFMMKAIISRCGSLFGNLKSLIDVGGGTGSAARTVARAFPGLNVTVLDLPHVVAELPTNTGVTFIGGDMFQYIPPAEAVFLKWILHDWNDEECVKILKKCKEAIPSKEEGGKVIIFDMVVNSNKEDYKITETQFFFDVLLLVLLTGGREREEHEWKKIFIDAGFTNYKITHVLGVRSLIEWILHDWNDEECVKILKKCKEAIPSKEEGGKVIIFDMVVNSNKEDYKIIETQFFFDVLMLVLATGGGHEREEHEWKKIFIDVGFTNYKITHVLGVRSLIEVYP